MPDIKTRLQENIKDAMRSQDKQRLAVLRLISAAIKQEEVDKRISLDDAQLIVILDKMAKQRRESISQFEKANRQDLVEQEEFELAIVQSYLPQPLSEAEIKILIDEALKTSQSTSMQDMGKVMAILKPQLQGRADMAKISQLIKDRLS